MVVELVLVADIFALAPCVFVDCIVNRGVGGCAWWSGKFLTSVIPAKGSGKTLLIGPRFTEALPANPFGKMLLVGTRFTEDVPAKIFGKMSPTGTRFIEAMKAVSGNGIPSTSSPGLVVIPAKGFG